VDGTTYLTEALNFTQAHMWRNFGIVVALWLFFVFLLVVSIERLPAAGSNKAILLYKRGGGGKFIRASAKNGNAPRDEEEGSGETQVNEKPRGDKQSKEDKKKKKDEGSKEDVFAANT
jgi:ATP-binding cassette subfamily G (WHITE) protein 2 (SNQ2)